VPEIKKNSNKLGTLFIGIIDVHDMKHPLNLCKTVEHIFTARPSDYTIILKVNLEEQ